MKFKINIQNLSFKNFIEVYKRRLILSLITLGLTAWNSAAQTSWTGATSSDWFDASNWSNGVPDANDDLIIMDTADDPVIGAAGAVANYITIDENAVLTIESAGQLNIELISTAVSQDALYILGTLNNPGIIVIGEATNGGRNSVAIGAIGIIHGAFNNFDGAVLQIDNFSSYGVFLSFAIVNSFTNEGTINIDGLGSDSFSNGIYCATGDFTIDIN
jgi:hypothetical protein